MLQIIIIIIKKGVVVVNSNYFILNYNFMNNRIEIILINKYLFNNLKFNYFKEFLLKIK